jgi:hypothetical protein
MRPVAPGLGCSVLNSRPSAASGLKIMGRKNGYASADGLEQALIDVAKQVLGGNLVKVCRRRARGGEVQPVAAKSTAFRIQPDPLAVQGVGYCDVLRETLVAFRSKHHRHLSLFEAALQAMRETPCRSGSNSERGGCHRPKARPPRRELLKLARLSEWPRSHFGECER